MEAVRGAIGWIESRRRFEMDGDQIHFSKGLLGFEELDPICRGTPYVPWTVPKIPGIRMSDWMLLTSRWRPSLVSALVTMKRQGQYITIENYTAVW